MSRRRLGHETGIAGAYHRWAALDRNVRRYLRSAWSERHAFSSGIVIPRPQSGTSAAWVIGLVGGILGLAWSLWQISPTSTVSPLVHGVLFVGSILLLAGSGVQLLAAWKATKLGNFTLVDPLRLWDVAAGMVTETTLDGILKARCSHRLESGRYAGSVVEVVLATGTARIEVPSREIAHECAEFLKVVAEAPATADATHLGARAAALARGEEVCRNATRVPAPIESIPGAADGRRSGRRRKERMRHEFDAASHGPGNQRNLALILACAFVPSALCAVFVFPSTRARMREDHAYELVALSQQEFAEIDAYLREYPHGRYAAAVRTLRDDRRYETARKQCERSQSPDPVRSYFADPENTRHRRGANRLIDTLNFKRARATSEEERAPAALRGYLADKEGTHHRRAAQKLIEGFYDAAAKRYEESPKTEKADTELVAGLADAVRKVRRASDPCLRVRFKGAYEARPSHPSEQLVLALHRMMMIQPGESFRERSIRKREKEILSRMTAAIIGFVGPGLMTIREAKEGERADIEFLYTVSASSTELYISRGGRFAAVDAGRAGEVRTVMHKYAINGTLVFHGRRQHDEHRGRLFGGPDEVIQIPKSVQGGDVYSSMLESAFDNFSKRLLEKLGLPAAAKAKSEPNR